MSFTIYEASVVAAKHLLKSLQGILTKAEAHPDAASFLERRLAPDMLPFSFQIWSVCALAESQALLLQGEVPPRKKYDEGPLPTYDAMRARMDQVMATLEDVDRETTIKKAAETMGLDFGRGSGTQYMTGDAFCAGIGIPNMYFHTAMAYAILRNAGVELGKLDYLGPFFAANIGM
ncbi:hypothetical protein PWT90_01037 [Aphanocladium album]|nr:hypothetical protein PWT90_01037 [Aphanocladium album]